MSVYVPQLSLSAIAEFNAAYCSVPPADLQLSRIRRDDIRILDNPYYNSESNSTSPHGMLHFVYPAVESKHVCSHDPSVRSAALSLLDSALPASDGTNTIDFNVIDGSKPAGHPIGGIQTGEGNGVNQAKDSKKRVASGLDGLKQRPAKRTKSLPPDLITGKIEDRVRIRVISLFGHAQTPAVHIMRASRRSVRRRGTESMLQMSPTQKGLLTCSKKSWPNSCSRKVPGARRCPGCNVSGSRGH